MHAVACPAVARPLRLLLAPPAGALLALLALAVPAAAQGPGGTAPAPVCDEAAYRCPDMVARAPAGLRIERTRAGRRILYATNRLDNVGTGPLDVRGTRPSTGQRSMVATQVIRGRGGRPILRRPAGSIVFKPIPGQGAYWKYSQALRFELRRPGPRAANRVVRTGPKVVYCLRDLLRQPFRRAGTPGGRTFGACNQGRRTLSVRMGVAVGWRESYPAGYHEQYVDVTGRRGCYALWHVADPLNRLLESDETNNANATRVRLPGRVGRAPQRC